MPTPAEIIAARANGTLEKLYPELSEKTAPLHDNASPSLSARSTASSLRSSQPSTASLADESAYPALGGASKKPVQTSNSSWGPLMVAAISGSGSESGSGSASPQFQSLSSTPRETPILTPLLAHRSNGVPSATKSKFKPSTIQEAFSLDSLDQLNVAKPEFIKILTSIKAETKTSIEATTSQHIKKRTFLISGKPEDVRHAKTLVIRKLTRPVTITFPVPSVIRSRIIGSQGKNLRPIVAENDVKIDIGSPNSLSDEEADDVDVDEDDIYAKTINISITGDAEGCKRAKALIMAIVSQETKNMSVRVEIASVLKAFAPALIAPIIAKYPGVEFSVPAFNSVGSVVVLIGGRQDVLDAKAEVVSVCDAFLDKLAIVNVPIPKIKHQFLPVSQVLEACNVFIKLPEPNETEVSFVGEISNIEAAQEMARNVTSQFKVDILDMSKAHHGNMKHVKAVAKLLSQNGVFKSIASEYDIVVNAPSRVVLESSLGSTIPIEIITKGAEDANKLKLAKKDIIHAVNKLSPEQALLIEDIDSFLIGRVNDEIKEIAADNKISFVILGSSVTLFCTAPEEPVEEDFDFAETAIDRSGLELVNVALNSLRELSASLRTAVLDISSEEQRNFVAGPHNSTLKIILGEVEPKSVEVRLNYDGEKEADDKLFVHGIKQSVASIVKSIESAVHEGKEFSNTYLATVTVVNSVLPRLIGKNGANMIALREEFGVKIDVDEKDGDSKSREPREPNSKVDIVISGVKKNVEAAGAHITQTSRKWADETISRVRVENEYHGRLIGANGIYSNRLQTKHNVKIIFPGSRGNRVAAEEPKNKDEIVIRGPSKSVAKAEEELLAFYKFEKDNGYKETINIPTEFIPRVMGRNHETIRDIADGAGVEYQYKRGDAAEAESGFGQIVLQGSRLALKEAKSKLDALLDELNNMATVSLTVDPKYHRFLIGPRRVHMMEIIKNAGGDDLPRQKYNRLIDVPSIDSKSDQVVCQGDKAIVDKVVAQIKAIIAEKEASVTETIDLAKEKHRLIIGPGGSIRRELEDAHSVSIEIPKSNSELTSVKISGLPENVQAAKEAMSVLTKDQWKAEVMVPANIHALVSERGAYFKTLKQKFGVQIQHGDQSRMATKLSGSTPPLIPEIAQPLGEEVNKFTVVANDEDSSSDEAIPWRIVGDAKNAAQAAKAIEKRVAIANNANHSGWLYVKNPSDFSKLIGPGGSKINQLRDQNDVFITISKDAKANPNFAYFAGSEENLKKAQSEAIKLLVQNQGA